MIYIYSEFGTKRDSTVLGGKRKEKIKFRIQALMRSKTEQNFL